MSSLKIHTAALEHLEKVSEKGKRLVQADVEALVEEIYIQTESLYCTWAMKNLNLIC